MKALTIDSGVRTYQINDSVEISFAPASAVFAETLMNMMDKLNGLQEATEAQRESVERDEKKVFEIVRARDAKITEAIDAVFGEGVTAKIFPWGPSAKGGGIPAWLNFCLALLDEIEEAASAQESEATPRIQKYIEKYKKYQRK